VELLVQVVSFGSAWWVRPGWDKRDPQRYSSHSAYFNSTGIRQAGKLHTAGPVRGLIRFNANSGLDPHQPQKSIGQTFRCHKLESFRETNRLLAVRVVHRSASPTHFLVCLSSGLHGVITLQHQTGPQIVSISRFRGSQETLVLLEAGELVETTVGIWDVKQSAKTFPALRLVDEHIPDSEGAGAHAI
jgi:hypothetical protein